jgi:hypothetical protein
METKKNVAGGAGGDAGTCAGTGTGTGTDVSNLLYNKLLLLMHYYADMEVDDPAAGPMQTDVTGQTNTAPAQGTDKTDGDVIRNVQAMLQPITTSYTLRPDLSKTENTGNQLVTQCSNAKKLSRSVTVHDCSATEEGPVFATGNATLPRIGSMFPADTDDYKKTFHGARITKNGTVVNEVISCSFDPKTLNCLACQIPHRIINANVPVTICFADQNFVPTVCCRSGAASSCLAVVRYEDASLAELTAIAYEILQGNTIPAGSVLLLGSASHLFRVGASTYAVDWVKETGKLEQRFKNVNICPLSPILRDTSPGPLVQDLETLTTWLHIIYESNIKGMLTSWDAVLHYAQHSASGPTTNSHEVLQKIPLPHNIKSTETTSTMIRFFSSNPAYLPGMSCTVTTELLNILLTTLQREFSISVGPEVSLPRATMASEDVKKNKNLVCVGSSILKQLIPHFRRRGM